MSVDPPRAIAVITHRRTEETASALNALIDAAHAAGVTVWIDVEEATKHRLEEGDRGVRVGIPSEQAVSLCVVLGGDGTILRALRHYGPLGIAVFAINYGEIGFLATVEPDHLEEGIERALTGDFELLRLPVIAISTLGNGVLRAINDVAIHRRVGERVAELSYAINDEEVGSVRCDGLVVATPAGSTGYNLANGGPVMAWGVAGFVVSFIAPHSLTARTLVVAPHDRLSIHNRSRDSLEVSVDGRPVQEISAGSAIDAVFVADQGTIAQLPDSSFYQRLQEKFGRLAR